MRNYEKAGRVFNFGLRSNFNSRAFNSRALLPFFAQFSVSLAQIWMSLECRRVGLQ